MHFLAAGVREKHRVLGGTAQFVVGLCCPGSQVGSQAWQRKSSPGITALCAAACCLKAESDPLQGLEGKL